MTASLVHDSTANRDLEIDWLSEAYSGVFRAGKVERTEDPRIVGDAHHLINLSKTFRVRRAGRGEFEFNAFTVENAVAVVRRAEDCLEYAYIPVKDVQNMNVEIKKAESDPSKAFKIWFDYGGGFSRRRTCNAFIQDTAKVIPLRRDRAATRPKPRGEVSTPEAETATFTPTPLEWTDGSDLDPRAWLYDGHYIRKFLSGTISPGGVGKSALKLAEAVSMATGRGLLTGKDIKPLRVWYWNGEDPEDETRRRAAAIFRHYGITRKDLGGRLFIDSGRSVEIVLAKETRGSLTIVEPVRDALIKAIKENEIDVLIIDPFVCAHEVSENDNNKINAVAGTFRNIADQANCSIELVHHARKTNGAEVTAEDSRGGVALINAVRQARVLNQMTKEEAAKNRVDEATRRRYFRMDDGKVNLGPYSEADNWFKIESVMLGNGRPGLAADNVGVVTLWSKPAAADGLPANAVELAQEAIAKGQWRAHVNSQDKWVGRPVAEALGLDLSDKTQKGRVSDLIKEWTEAGYLKVVKRPDDNGDERPFCIIGKPWWP